MKKLASFAEKAFSVLDKITEGIGMIGVAVMFLSATVNIALRWITGRSYGQLDEISLMALCWIVYVGVGLLYHTEEHIAMDFILRAISPKAREAVEFVNGLIGLAVSSAVVYLGVKLMLKSFNRTLNITNVPYSFMHLAVVIGFACYALFVLFDTVKSVAKLFRKDKEA